MKWTARTREKARVVKVLKTVYSFVEAREQLALDKFGVLDLRTKRDTEHSSVGTRGTPLIGEGQAKKTHTS